MEWTEAIKVGGTIAPVIGVGVWALIETRGRRVFASKNTEDLAKANQRQITLLTQAQEHQAELMKEAVVKPLGEIAEEVKAIRTGQQQAEVQIAHLTEGQKSLGRSLDELRARVDRERR